MANLQNPSKTAFAITPHNTNALARNTRAIWVGGAGNVKVDMAGGDTGITFSGVAAGTLLPICVIRVYATGTTATLLIGID
jgi:hypothetical protein